MEKLQRLGAPPANEAAPTFPLFKSEQWLSAFVAVAAVSAVLALLAYYVLDSTKLLWMFPAAGLALLAVSKPKFTVGTDGVLYTWLRTKHFFAYADIASVTREGNDLCIVSRTGESTLFASFMVPRREYREAIVRLEPVIALVNQRRDAFLTGADTRADDVTDALMRKGRPAAQWLEDVSDLTKPHDYRTAPAVRTAVVTAEELLDVVEDPNAAPTARAGAAAALNKRLDEPGRERIRVAAKATVNPEVSAVLVRVAEGADDAAMIEALGEIEARAER